MGHPRSADSLAVVVVPAAVAAVVLALAGHAPPATAGPAPGLGGSVDRLVPGPELGPEPGPEPGGTAGPSREALRAAILPSPTGDPFFDAVPDHQGPEMAYADPVVAGHAILDAIRGLRTIAPEHADARVGLTGYSGGAIAALGAAKLLDSYAPDLADTMAAVSIGGVPADFEMLLDSMSGNLGVGLLTAAVFGLSRHNPELLDLSNGLAHRMAVSPLRDQCVPALAAMGATLAPIEALAVGDDALTSPTARAFYARARMADVAIRPPLYVYQGAQEFWVPTAGTRALVAEQCALGVTVEYREVPGEHLVAMATGFGDSMTWLDRTLRGGAPASTC